METLIRRRVLRRLIWVITVCLLSTKRTLGLNGLRVKSKLNRQNLHILQYAGYFCTFLSSADFFRINIFKNSFRNTIKVSNSLNQEQARHFVGPDVGPNCPQRTSADDTCVCLEEKLFKFVQCFNMILVNPKSATEKIHLEMSTAEVVCCK